MSDETYDLVADLRNWATHLAIRDRRHEAELPRRAADEIENLRKRLEDKEADDE